MRQASIDDLAALAVDGGDELVRADGGRQRFGEGECRSLPPLNSAEPTIAWVAPPAMTLDARSTVRIPPPTRQGSAAQILVTRSLLCPWFFAASRSISCTLGQPREPVDPFVDGVALEREAFALDELHDAAAHEVD